MSEWGGDTVVVACHLDVCEECEEIERCCGWMWEDVDRWRERGAEVKSLFWGLRYLSLWVETVPRFSRPC